MELSAFHQLASEQGLDAEDLSVEIRSTSTTIAVGEKEEPAVLVASALEDEGDLVDGEHDSRSEDESGEPWLETDYLSWAQRITGDLCFADQVERDLHIATPPGVGHMQPGAF